MKISSFTLAFHLKNKGQLIPNLLIVLLCKMICKFTEYSALLLKVILNFDRKHINEDKLHSRTAKPFEAVTPLQCSRCVLLRAFKGSFISLPVSLAL